MVDPICPGPQPSLFNQMLFLYMVQHDLKVIQMDPHAISCSLRVKMTLNWVCNMSQGTIYPTQGILSTVLSSNLRSSEHDLSMFSWTRFLLVEVHSDRLYRVLVRLRFTSITLPDSSWHIQLRNVLDYEERKWTWHRMDMETGSKVIHANMTADLIYTYTCIYIWEHANAHAYFWYHEKI